MSSYVLKVPISAILDKQEGQNASVKIPAGAVLRESAQPSTTLLGMIGVYWEGRHYSVSFRDLARNADLVEGA